MKNINKYLIFNYFFSILSITSMGQTQDTIFIFNDDDSLLSTYMGNFENSKKQPYYAVRPFDFKESLPDGIYYYINGKRKDRLKIDISDNILIEGKYVDSARIGEFKYYSFCKLKGKEKRVLTDVYNYSRGGLLNGYYMSKSCRSILYEGHYKKGLRDGFFFFYNADGELISLELYEDNILKYYSTFPNITIVKPAADTIHEFKIYFD